MNPVFNDFQAACDWIDDHTSPENAGAFVIVETECGYTVQLFRQPENENAAKSAIF